MENDISKEQILKLLKFFIHNIETNDFDFNQIKDIDYYWDIVDNKKLYNPYEKEIENDISLWQISEDWETLIKLMNWEIKRDIIAYDFKLLSVIIRLLQVCKK